MENLGYKEGSAKNRRISRGVSIIEHESILLNKTSRCEILFILINTLIKLSCVCF